jgi:hypothetical protein
MVEERVEVGREPGRDLDPLAKDHEAVRRVLAPPALADGDEYSAIRGASEALAACPRRLPLRVTQKKEPVARAREKRSDFVRFRRA